MRNLRVINSNLINYPPSKECLRFIQQILLIMICWQLIHGQLKIQGDQLNMAVIFWYLGNLVTCPLYM